MGNPAMNGPDGTSYILGSSNMSMPVGTTVYRFSVPPNVWDLLTVIEAGEVKHEWAGSVQVRWACGIWGTTKKEWVCVKTPS